MAFPTTQHSLVAALADADAGVRARAFEAVVTIYWRPAYTHARVHLRQNADQARDLVQGFFAHAWERGEFARHDPARGRFRTWLRVCLEGFASNERQAAARQKRGGGAPHVPLDFAAEEQWLERQPPGSLGGPEQAFEREWLRSLVEDALAALRARCERDGQRERYELFVARDVDDAPGAPVPSYTELAARFGMSEAQVTNTLHRVRREFRQHLLARLRELTCSDEEFRAEARCLFGRENA